MIIMFCTMNDSLTAPRTHRCPTNQYALSTYTTVIAKTSANDHNNNNVYIIILYFNVCVNERSRTERNAA